MAETYFIRSPKNRNYTVMSNVFLKDTRLSFKAKGLFAYLLTLPEDWKIYVNHLITVSSDGKTAVLSAMKELRTYGYLRKEQATDEKGRFCGVCYYIEEEPEIETQTENPKTENPFTDNPKTENPPLPNTNNNQIRKKENTKVRGETTSEDLASILFDTKGDNQTSISDTIIRAVNTISDNKKSKKKNNTDVMLGMIEDFTQHEVIREKLKQYFTIRVKKGLKPEQWKILLDDLREYTKGDAKEAIKKLDTAISGGYMTIIASWEKEKRANYQFSGKKPNNHFDTTAGYKPPKGISKYTDEEKAAFYDNLVKDENGKLKVF